MRRAPTCHLRLLRHLHLHLLRSKTTSRSDMARLHGNKRYYQVLLDDDRAQEVEAEATRKGIRVTALMREWIYQKLKELL